MSAAPVVAIITLVALAIAIIVLMIVATWKIYAKMQRPGWASLVPVYKTVVMLEALRMPLWLIVLMVVPFGAIAVWIVMCIRLARAFGKDGWFTAGLILLPFIFYPILAFGDAQYQEASIASGITETVKWTLIGTAALGICMWLSMTLGNFIGSGQSLTMLSGGLGYATDGRHVYQYDLLIPGADARSFTPLSDYYAVDAYSVFYNGARISRADARTFELLGDQGYARDAYAGYYDGQRISDDAAAFEVPGYLYAKDSTTVYFAGDVLTEADAASFVVPDIKDYYAMDKDAVYYDGAMIEGADPATFRMEMGAIGDLPYDSRDKNHYYYYGVDAHEYADLYSH